jgi:hypothetical protein
MKSVNTDTQHAKRRLVGFFCLLAAAYIVFIVTVPLFAYLSYRGIRPAFLLTFIALGIPCAMLLAQKYVVFLQHLYRTKYMQFTVSVGGSSIAKELDLTVSNFELHPNEARMKQLQMMERAGLLERKLDGLAIVWDAPWVICAGVSSYYIALSIQLGTHFFPIYAAILGCIISPLLLPRSRGQYAWNRMHYKYRPDELYRTRFDYNRFVSRVPPPSQKV